jgi:uncharacterized membrane protein
MMRRWLMPLLLCAVFGTFAYHATLIATPFVLMRVSAAKAGKGLALNRFAFGPMTTAENQTIVRPSPDLAYSLCVFDVSRGPVMVRVEPVPGHYWSVSIFDARTDVAAVRSDRDTGGKPAMLALVKPGQEAPVGYDAIPIKYDKGVALVRILISHKAEFAAIDALRRKSFCKGA